MTVREIKDKLMSVIEEAGAIFDTLNKACQGEFYVGPSDEGGHIIEVHEEGCECFKCIVRCESRKLEEVVADMEEISEKFESVQSKQQL